MEISIIDIVNVDTVNRKRVKGERYVREDGSLIYAAE